MTERLEVAILGGGILGLLTLRVLRARRVPAYLFEHSDLGSAQTLDAQAYLIRGHLYAMYARSPGSVVEQ
jgi:glycerol-3-phosphate dehydrogenase